MADPDGALEGPDRPDDGLDPFLRAAFTPPAAPAPVLPPEERLGPYRLIREIGHGGQAVVYLAEDTRLRRPVAVKALPAARGASEEARARFEREARIAARLRHPSICGVLDFGIHEETPFLVMPFVEGASLEERLAAAQAGGESCLRLRPGEEPSLEAILDFFERVARAVHAAHEAGVVHRDLKPGNLMVTPQGEPVVLDFGVARDEEGGGPPLTRAGEAFGTPAYMSPEQLRPGAVAPDRRADVWSLGVTLYEALTLRRPFEGVSRAAVAREIRAADPRDPRHWNPALPRDLSVVLARALEKEPERRYGTLLELAEELDRVRRRRPILARPSGRLARLGRWARRERAVAATLVSVFLGLAASLTASLAFLGETRAAVRRVQESRAGAGRQTRRADAAAVAARETASAYERLADIRRLQDLLHEQREDLWPALPEKVPAMEAWLARALALALRLPEHQEALESLRTRGRSEQGERWVFANARDQWRNDLQARFVEDLRSFATGAGPVDTIRSVEDRRAFASEVRRRTVEAEREAWQRAARAVAGDPRYRGLELRPQTGLIPLGPDPDSGLQEFWHLQSGARPEREPSTGRLRPAAEDGVVLVLIPGGSFLMGAQARAPALPNHDPDARDSEAPVRGVRLDPFFIAKHEMTQGQWLRATGTNPSHLAPGSPVLSAEHAVTLLHPVEQVSFLEARDVLRRLALELPTEARWEYACRARTETPWWTGATAETLRGAANLADRAAFREAARWVLQDGWAGFDDGWPWHAPSHRLRASPWGLHGMIGNVEEWCADRDGSYEAAPRAGDGLREGTADRRIARGGSFKMGAGAARSTARYSHAPGFKDTMLGIRPARGAER